MHFLFNTTFGVATLTSSIRLPRKCSLDNAFCEGQKKKKQFGDEKLSNGTNKFESVCIEIASNHDSIKIQMPNNET